MLQLEYKVIIVSNVSVILESYHIPATIFSFRQLYPHFDNYIFSAYLACMRTWYSLAV